MKSFLVTKDFTDDFNEVIKRFRHDEVLVGIPEEEAPREGDEPVNNATLLALNNFGSPVNGIPARPVMEIGIRNAQEEIVKTFEKGVERALSGGLSTLHETYNRAGIIAANSVKKAINSQEGIEPPADATLIARKAAGFSGEKALIVSGQMRNAITHVVKGRT